MAVLYKSKRVIFAKGEQKKFLVRVKNKQKISWAHMAKFLRVSNRSLGDWTREKFSMPLSAAQPPLHCFYPIINHLKNQMKNGRMII